MAKANVQPTKTQVEKLAAQAVLACVAAGGVGHSKDVVRELPELRTQFSKTFLNSDGTRTAIIHGKSICYEPAGPGTGGWQDVAPAPVVKAGGGWEATKNYWTADFPAGYGTGWVALSRRGGFTLRYKLAAVGHVSSGTERTLTILQTAQNAVGQLAAGVVSYPGVFSGVTVKYKPDHDYLKISVEMSQAAKTALRNAIKNQGLDANGWLALGFRVDVSQMGDWALGLHENEEADGGIAIKAPLGWIHRAKDHIAAGSVTDESPETSANHRANVKYRLVNHPQYGLVLLALIPLAWLAQSVGAVTLDPTYYGETADGHIYGYSTDYATASSTSYGLDATGITLAVGQYFITPDYLVARGFLSIPTANLPDDATVTAAMLYVCANTDYSDTDFNVQCYRYVWLETLAANREADYDGAYGGSATLEGTLRNTASGWVSGTYYSLAVANAGINLTGDSKYTLVSSRDIAGTAPTGNEHVFCCSADYANTDHDPYLSITYALNVTVSPPAMAATAEALLPVITAIRNVVIAAAVAVATALMPAPDVTVGTGVTLSPPVMAATAESLVPVVGVTVSATVSPPAMAATAEALVPGVTAGTGVTLSPPVAEATAEALVPAVTAIRHVTISPPAFTATAEAPVPGVTVGTGVTVSPPVMAATAEAWPPSVEIRKALCRHKFLLLDTTTPAMFETWQEMEYTRERFGLGRFKLVLPVDHAQSAALVKGKRVLIVRDDGLTQEARFWGVVTTVRKRYKAEAGPALGGSGKGQVFVEVQGVSFTEYYLSGRIFTAPAPGSIPATDHLDDAFKSWVKYNLVGGYASADRAVAGFSVEADEHAGPSGSYEITYNLLLERIMALSKRYGVGVEIVGAWGSGAAKLNAAASYTFQTCVPEGVDRTHDQGVNTKIIITREWGLVRTLEYEQDASTERNVIIALGNQSAEEDGIRDQQTVTISPMPTGETRREGVLVVGDGATAADLTDIATKFLNDEGIALESVRFEYAHPAPYTPLTDFLSGDQVSFYDLVLGIGPWQPVVEEITCRIGGEGLEKYEIALGRFIRPAEAEDSAYRVSGKRSTLSTRQNSSARPGGPSIPGSKIVGSIPAGSLPAHVLATTAGLGEKHTTSGLTENQVLLATGATTAKFGSLPEAGLPAHVLATTAGLGERHTVSGLTANQVLVATGPTTVAFGSLPFDATVPTDNEPRAAGDSGDSALASRANHKHYTVYAIISASSPAKTCPGSLWLEP